MKTPPRIVVLPFLICLMISSLSAQLPHEDHKERPGNRLAFIQNQGQWETPVLYRVGIGDLNALYLEDHAFTWLFHDPEQSHELHDDFYKNKSEDNWIDAHAYTTHFIGANQPIIEGLDKRSLYYNYFIGNDKNKWASDVPVYDKIKYNNLYNDIHLEAYSDGDAFKYDFVVLPDADVSQIQLEYEGVESLAIKQGALIITTSVETIHELEPFAWQLINGTKKKVACQYHLDNNIVTFHFPEGYNRAYTLTIDPIVVAATLSGTTGNKNFGHTATFDNNGDIYTGGISFGAGYPTTLGAFQSNFGGGFTDFCISKYNTTGSQLLYATYVGGLNRDYPHSMIVDFSGQLYVYGSTNSNDFPTTDNAYQRNLGGNYDIVVVKLNASGTELVGSTFIGGSGIDGHNMNEYKDNYGDKFRGEIILDAQGNAYITSNTQSVNFPVTTNAFDITYDVTAGPENIPDQDAVVFKLNSDFSTLYWSTFIGGDGADTGSGLRLDDAGNVYVTGTAGGSNFPNVGGGYQSNFLGGHEDAYVVLLSADGSELLRSTFFGTTSNEHSYFMDIDEEDNVHIYGQTTGNITPTPNTYSTNNNSPQFLAAFDKTLSNLVYATNIGTGPMGNTFQFVPVAFMVDKCDHIYFSGYYAVSGLPTTPDAILPFADDVFYLGVLEPLAAGLSYGTYYGNADHVDGGTSRFDKSGTVYQGVCSCTWSGANLNTLGNAWSTSTNLDCDVGVFKIDFEVPTVTASAFAWPATSGCLPFDVNFTYTGQDATEFYWEFGDGASSTQINPAHTYTEAGTHQVMMVASSPITCNISDTFYIKIDVLDGTTYIQDTAICEGVNTVYLDATITNASYLWQDGSTGATMPVSSPGSYWVTVDIGTCNRVDSFIVNAASNMVVNLGSDLSACNQNTFTIESNVNGAINYQWNTGATSADITVSSAGEYWLAATDNVGCVASDTVTVRFGETPLVALGEYDRLCEGETVFLDASSTSNVTYLWQDGSTEPTFTVAVGGTYSVTLDNNGCTNSDEVTIDYFPIPSYAPEVHNIVCSNECNGSIEIILPNSVGPLDFLWSTGSRESALTDLCAGNYEVTITDEFGCSYEEFFNIINPAPLNLELKVNSVVCFGDNNGTIDIVSLVGGFEPYDFILNGISLSENATTIGDLSGGTYELVVSDAGGCTLSETVSVYEPPSLQLYAGDDRNIDLGDTVQVNGFVKPFENQFLEWTPTEHFSECIDCPNPVVQPISTTGYILTAIDEITGCIRRDSLTIFVDKTRKIYIPNAFSPNYDGLNDIFMIYGGPGIEEILTFRIFDRWGEQLFEETNFQANDRSYGWDGTFKGEDMDSGVFVYMAEIAFIDGVKIRYSGDVSLLK